MQTVPEQIKALRQERNPLPLKKESRRDKNAKEVKKCQKATMTTYANQCNPNNDAYWESRGDDERPDDWKERIDDEEDE